MKEIIGGNSGGEVRQATYRKDYRQVVEAEERSDYRMLDAAKLTEEDMVVHLDPRKKYNTVIPPWGWAIEYEARTEVGQAYSLGRCKKFDHAAIAVEELEEILGHLRRENCLCQALAVVLYTRKNGKVPESPAVAALSAEAVRDWSSEAEREANKPGRHNGQRGGSSGPSGA